MNEDTKLKVYLALIAITLIIIFSQSFVPFSLVGVGGDMTLNVIQKGVPYKYVIKSSDDYYVQDGCQKTCESLNSCKVDWGPIDHYELGCPVRTCYTTGFYDCDSRGYTSNCAYGAMCSPKKSYYKTCDRHCDWETHTHEDKGGISYDSVDGCSWALYIYDANNNLVKKYDQTTYMGEYWRTDRIYTTQEINDQEFRVTIPYGNVLNAPGGCYYFKFAVADDFYRYRGCIGNDWPAGDSSHCKDSVVKECILTRDRCGPHQRVDTENCKCVDLTEWCGDGKINQGNEECDDGNEVSGDHCSADCKIEEWCGNSNVDPNNEECDGSATKTCQDLGFSYGTISCNSQCVHDVSGCRITECGNSVLEPDETSATCCEDAGCGSEEFNCVSNVCVPKPKAPEVIPVPEVPLEPDQPVNIPDNTPIDNSPELPPNLPTMCSDGTPLTYCSSHNEGYYCGTDAVLTQDCTKCSCPETCTAGQTKCEIGNLYSCYNNKFQRIKQCEFGCFDSKDCAVNTKGDRLEVPVDTTYTGGGKSLTEYFAPDIPEPKAVTDAEGVTRFETKVEDFLTVKNMALICLAFLLLLITKDTITGKINWKRIIKKVNR